MIHDWTTHKLIWTTGITIKKCMHTHSQSCTQRIKSKWSMHIATTLKRFGWQTEEKTAYARTATEKATSEFNDVNLFDLGQKCKRDQNNAMQSIIFLKFISAQPSIIVYWAWAGGDVVIV